MPDRPGQPTKYKPEYCQELIDTMREGLSLSSFCSKIGVSRETAYEWMRRHDEFSDAHKIAKEHAQNFWERVLRQTALGKMKGNVGGQIFWLKNRFADDWKDKRVFEPEGDSTITLNYSRSDLKEFAKGVESDD